jgi:hypothetical protein
MQQLQQQQPAAAFASVLQKALTQQLVQQTVLAK